MTKYRNTKIEDPIYKSHHPDKLMDLMAKGKFNAQICTFFKISERTFERWRHDHEDFLKAYEIGEPQRESFWIDYGVEGLQGKIKGFNYNAWRTFMDRHFKGYQKQAEAAGQTTNISIQNMQVLEGKDRKGLIEYIQAIGHNPENQLEVEFIDVTDSKPTDSI